MFDRSMIYSLLSDVTVQFYYSKNGQETPYASGVLFQHDERYFIFTASHLFWNDGSNIQLEDLKILPNNNNFLTLVWGSSILYRSNPANSRIISDRNHDNIDIAVIELDRSLEWIYKSDLKFLKIQELGIDHEYSENNEYTILGYPSFGSLINHEELKIKKKLFFSSTKLISLNIHIKEKIKNSQIALDRQKIVESKSKIKDRNFEFNGISGCGLWYHTESDSKVSINLVGIMVYDEITRGYLVATKIEMITELLRNTSFFNLIDISKPEHMNVTIN